MRIRLKDIARDLNVTVITVSKALRGNTDISETTRQRVLARMKELDYQPNMTARGLATGVILQILIGPTVQVGLREGGMFGADAQSGERGHFACAAISERSAS